MIDTEYVVMMARYNAWQNKQITDILKAMDDGEHWCDRAGFSGSIMHRLSQLLWDDTLWMSLWCDDVKAPHQEMSESSCFCKTFGDWQAMRFQMDGRIRMWAETLSNLDLIGTLSWYSNELERDVEVKHSLCIARFFNQQTHHRSQVHAMLAIAKQAVPVSDLFLMPEHF